MNPKDLITQLAQVEQNLRLLKSQLKEQNELRLRLLGAIEYQQQIKEEEEPDEDAAPV